jgi:hypothetical protein
MTEFETRLSECLEALREGRWDIGECLRRYPEHADALRPHLVAARSLMATLGAAAPREEFAAAARQRFLIASGQRLSEAFDIEPQPSFFVAARVRFLMAAQRMRLGQNAPQRRFGRIFQDHVRGLAGAAAVLVVFLSFSTYTVASADNALPGDWQYPVKLQTERVRLTLTFSDGARRSVQLDIAEERAREIGQMTKRGRIIGPGVLNRLVDQTKPLVDDAGDGWDTGDIARLHTIAELEQVTLQQAEPQVDPAAQESLAAARDVSKQAVVLSDSILVMRPDALPRVVTPSVPLVAAQRSTPTPLDGSATPDASSTPGPTGTSTAPASVRVDNTPETTKANVSWIRLAAGRFTTLIPSPADGWSISGMDVAAGPAPAPSLMKLSNADGTSLITFNLKTGDMYWFIDHGGRFDEIQMRIALPDGRTVVADGDYLRQVYGDSSAIPRYMLANIAVEPLPTATPATEPTATGTAGQ